MKIFRKIVVSCLVLGGVLVITAAILGRIYEDEITQYVVAGFNEQISTRAEVGDVTLSFLKKFPDASLEIREVTIFSVLDADTLLRARRLYLSFNVVRLLQKQYLLKEVHFHQGMLNLLVDGDGNKNYVCWNKAGAGDGESFSLNIDNLKLTDIKLKFENRTTDMALGGNVEKGRFKGNFTREEYTMTAGIEGVLHHYTKRGNPYFQDQQMAASASLRVDPMTVEILAGELGLSGQLLDIRGKIIRPRPLEYELELRSKHLDLERVLRYGLLKGMEIPEDLKAGGDMSFQARVTGMATHKQMPRIDARFSLRNGWLKASAIPYGIRDLRTDGEYSNGRNQGPESTRILLSQTSLLYGNSRLGGNYQILNLAHPRIDYQIKAELDLADVPSLLSVDTIFRNMDGMLLAEIHGSGSPASLDKIESRELLNFQYDTKLRLEGVNLALKYKSMDLRNLSGELYYKDYLIIRSLEGQLEDMDVSLTGRADNLLEFLFTESGNLWLDADVNISRADLNKLPLFDPTDSPVRDTVNLPDRLFAKTTYRIGELQAKKFNASQVAGALEYRPRRLTITRLNLQSMNGKVDTEGILEQQHSGQYLVKSISTVEGIDIAGAFASFGNFGQDFILEKHIRGRFSGLVNFSARLNQNMKIQKESILADCDIVIQDGELNGFEPMRKLSRFIDVEELEDITFSTLANQIFIRNEEVIIPKMDIHSSAFDLSGSGLHGFDNNFTYRIKVSLSELLSKKAKNTGGQETEFGVIADDGEEGVFIYLIIEGSQRGTIVRYDRRGAIQNVKVQLREEKKELKEILNEEFGWFAKDSTLQSGAEKEKESGLLIEWEEDPGGGAGADTVKTVNQPDPEEFIIVWDDEEESDTVRVEDKKRRRRKRK